MSGRSTRTEGKLVEPTSGFINWWVPNGHNPKSGAQTGGHRDALRKCVQPETREVRYYGIKAIIAFNTACYRDEYHSWLKAGQPPRTTDYDGTAATPERVRECLGEVREILRDSPITSKPLLS